MKKILKILLYSLLVFFSSICISLRLSSVQQIIKKNIIKIGLQHDLHIDYDEIQFHLPCRISIPHITITDKNNTPIVTASELTACPLFIDLFCNRISFIYLSGDQIDFFPSFSQEESPQNAPFETPDISCAIYRFTCPKLTIHASEKEYSIGVQGQLNHSYNKTKITLSIQNETHHLHITGKRKNTHFSYYGHYSLSLPELQTESTLAFSGKTHFLHPQSLPSTIHWDFQLKKSSTKQEIAAKKCDSIAAIIEEALSTHAFSFEKNAIHCTPEGNIAAKGSFHITKNNEYVLNLTEAIACGALHSAQIATYSLTSSLAGSIRMSPINQGLSEITWDFPHCAINDTTGSYSGKTTLIFEKDHLLSLSASLRGTFIHNMQSIPLCITVSIRKDIDDFAGRTVISSLPIHLDCSYNQTPSKKTLCGFFHVHDLSFFHKNCSTGELSSSITYDSSGQTPSSITLSIADVSSPQVSIEHCSITCRSCNSFQNSIQFQTTIRNTLYKSFVLSNGSSYGSFFPQTRNCSIKNISLQGAVLEKPFTIEGSFETFYDNSKFSILVPSCTGSLNNCSFSLKKPASFALENGTLTQAHCSSFIEKEGYFDCLFDKTAGSSTFETTLHQIPLQILPLKIALYGFLDGKISLQSSEPLARNKSIRPLAPSKEILVSSFTKGIASCTCSKLRYGVLGGENAEFALGIDATMDTSSIKTTFCLGGTSIIDPILGEINVQTIDSKNLFGFTLDTAEPLSGCVRGSFNIAKFLTTWSPKEVHLDGIVAADFSLSGTLRKPFFHGPILIKEGQVEVPSIGLNLAHIEIAGTATDDKIHVHTISGTDEKDGFITGTGSFSYRNSGYNWETNLICKEYEALSLDGIKARADGNVQLIGNESSLVIKGTPKIVSGICTLSYKKHKPIPLLDIVYEDAAPVEFFKRNVSNFPEDCSSRPSPYAVFLELAIDGRKGILIKGKGFSSKWKGHVHLMGELPNLETKGKFLCSKGALRLGSQIAQVKNGIIEIRGNLLIDSTIRLISTIETPQITAQAIISGQLLNPKFSLQSTPSRPDNEILSLILFNKEYADISPFESIQLAHTALHLRQSSSPLDIFDAIKKTLGIDFLDISSNPSPFSLKKGILDPSDILSSSFNQNTINLRVGKYLTKKIAVVVSRDVTDSANKFGIQAHVADNVTATAEVSDKQTGILSLKWRKDY